MAAFLFGLLQLEMLGELQHKPDTKHGENCESRILSAMT
jgi:hypothetical protein